MSERPYAAAVQDLPDLDTSTDDEFLDALDREVQQLEQQGHEPERRPNMSLEEVRREVEAAAEDYERSKAKTDKEDEPDLKELPGEPVCSEEVNKEEEEEEDGGQHDIREDPEIEARRRREEAMSQEEVQHLKSQALGLKKDGNELYASDNCEEAVTKYKEALETCPLTFKDDRAVLFSNMAAAKMRLKHMEEALEDCSQALQLKPDYLKAYARRGHIFEELDKPHEAMKDFEKVLEMDKDHKEARRAVQRLPPKIAKKDEEIKQEMFTNLKKLGNMVLNPFGLSTENFNFVQDPNTGSYSVNFSQNPQQKS